MMRENGGTDSRANIEADALTSFVKNVNRPCYAI